MSTTTALPKDSSEGKCQRLYRVAKSLIPGGHTAVKQAAGDVRPRPVARLLLARLAVARSSTSTASATWTCR